MDIIKVVAARATKMQLIIFAFNSKHLTDLQRKNLFLSVGVSCD